MFTLGLVYFTMCLVRALIQEYHYGFLISFDKVVLKMYVLSSKLLKSINRVIKIPLILYLYFQYHQYPELLTM